MKKILNVHYTDFWREWQYENFIHDILLKEYDAKLNPFYPDVVFYSIFGQEHLKYKNCLKILYLGENTRYNYSDKIKENINLAYRDSHYTISFDPHSATNYRLPNWQTYIMKMRDMKMLERTREPHDNDRWCAYIVSNAANIFRTSAFLKLCEYRQVHSYGKAFNNDKALMKYSEKRYWRDAKMEFFKIVKHKFMFAMENSMYPYYCTEKLMDAFIGESVPIYWGDPKVNEDWNEKAFINITNKTISEIIKVDKDVKLYESIAYEPMFTDEQTNRHFNNIEGFENWIINKING